jgi:hypothetical protein
MEVTMDVLRSIESLCKSEKTIVETRKLADELRLSLLSHLTVECIRFARTDKSINLEDAVYMHGERRRALMDQCYVFLRLKALNDKGRLEFTEEAKRVLYERPDHSDEEAHMVETIRVNLVAMMVRSLRAALWIVENGADARISESGALVVTGGKLTEPIAVGSRKGPSFTEIMKLTMARAKDSSPRFKQ